jgi:hypothetical protein
MSQGPRRVRQPSLQTQIDWGSPLARGLQLRLVPRFGATVFDQVTSTSSSGTVTSASPSNGYSALGYGHRVAAGGAIWNSPRNLNSTAFSIFARMMFSSTTGGFAGFLTWGSQDGATAIAGLQLNGSSATVVFTGSGQLGMGSSMISTTPINFGFTYNAGAVSIWRNGQKVSTGSVTAITIPTAQRFVFGGARLADATNVSTGNIEFVCYWNRVLSDTEFMLLNANPWAMMKVSPLRRMQPAIYVAPTGTWKTTLGLASGSTKTVEGLARASIKRIQGLTP